MFVIESNFHVPKIQFLNYLCGMKHASLDQISSPAELRQLPLDELPMLAKQMRERIIEVVAAREGHLGASLGVVELTIALHYVFHTPDDLLIWDVGHQAYGHKLLTGRYHDFETNRQLNGLSGFPKRSESPYDVFGTGHSSTSISAALGMAIAAQIQGNTEREHIAVIGDASIASGMAFEALNHAGETNANLLVILNDNAIGIDPSVGALKSYLTDVKAGRNPKGNNLMKALNFAYSGPIDGHDLPTLIKALERLKKHQGPRFLHLITTKGKGLKLAEEQQVIYHAPGKFDKLTGKITPKILDNQPPKFQDVFGKTLVELADLNPKIVGITPAMPTGSSLKYLMETHPNRAFDVGIAEQHAVTFAAGLATQGLLPYCTIYSSFLQRAYDQVIHDVALQHLPVIFCIDRAGLVGEDGPTHHGSFDIAFLNCIPQLSIWAPLDEIELRQMLYNAQLQPLTQPLAIRYPRGQGFYTNWQTPFEPHDFEKVRCLHVGEEVAVLTTGVIGNRVREALQTADLQAKCSHYHFACIKPLDESALPQIFAKYRLVITVEEGTVVGGFGSSIQAWAQAHHYTQNVQIMGIPDAFIPHGKPEELYEICGLDVKTLRATFECC